MAAPRVIVVGAGPAGIRAAQALVRAGLRPLLVDEGELDGGRIYARRAAPLAIDPQELYGADAAAAQSVHTAFDALRAQVDLRTGVLAPHDRTLCMTKVTAAAPHGACPA